jgi:type IX secretion system PorP/SprF family membrane protein
MVFRLSNELKLKPSTLIKYSNGTPLQIDLNANLWIHDAIGVGTSYRTGDAFVILLEIQASPNFRMGYAYDYPLTILRTYSSGSHEIMLRYEFTNKSNKVISPRYF